MLAIIGALGRLNALIGLAGVIISAAFIAAMTLIVITGVVFRYGLGSSITWVEDVSLIMMVSVAFLVAPWGYRNGANVAIDMLVSLFPQAVVRLVRLALNLLVLWVIWRLFGESLALVKRGWGIRVNTVPIPWAWPYMLVPGCFVAMALAGIELILRDLHALATGSRAADLPHLAPAETE